MSSVPDFVTAFEIGRLSNGVWSDALFNVIIGIVALIIGAAEFVRWWRRKSGRSWGWLASFLIVGWSVLWLHDSPAVFAHIDHLVDACQKKQYQVVEGEVRVLRQQPAHGHASGDLIVVNGMKFEVNHFVATPAYRDAAARFCASTSASRGHRKPRWRSSALP